MNSNGIKSQTLKIVTNQLAGGDTTKVDILKIRGPQSTLASNHFASVDTTSDVRYTDYMKTISQELVFQSSPSKKFRLPRLQAEWHGIMRDIPRFVIKQRYDLCQCSTDPKTLQWELYNVEVRDSLNRIYGSWA